MSRRGLLGCDAEGRRRAVRAGALVAACAIASLTTALPARASSDACPNAQFRVGPSGGLPDCRAYELVSPPLKSGGNASVLGLTDDGSSVLFSSTVGFGDAPSFGGLGADYVSRRGADRWNSTSIMPPKQFLAQGLRGHFDLSPDFGRALVYGATTLEYGRGAGAFYLIAPDGSASQVTQTLSPLGDPVQTSFIEEGASADLSHIVFQGSGALFPGQPSMSGSGSENLSVYESVGSSPSAALRQVNVSDDGTSVIGGGCGAVFGGQSSASGGQAGVTHAVSADGSVIFFSSRLSSADAEAAPGAVCRSSGVGTLYKLRVFARRASAPAGDRTVQVSKSQCSATRGTACLNTVADDIYAGASADGTKVFFTSTRQLTSSDTDNAGNDLYMYDFSQPLAQRLVQVSAGEANPAHPVIGAGGGVLGVVRLSEDGSRVYFAATGVLTTTPNAQGQVAAGTGPKLYVYERDAGHPAGRLAYVSTLSPSDTTLWSKDDAQLKGAQAMPLSGPCLSTALKVCGDGHVLVFQTYAALTPDDQDSAQDVYRYNDATGSLERVSMGGDAGRGNGAFDATIPGRSYYGGGALASYAQRYRTATENGDRIVFTTAEALVPQDTNNAPDAYEWTAGHGVSLISDGTTPTGSTSVLISPTGGDIVFSTIGQLVGQDVDSAQDVYDARVGGGYPPPAAQSPPCGGDACLGPLATAPLIAAPATTTSTNESAVAGGAPAFSVQAVSAKQRAALAASGKLTLRVRASDPGTLSAHVTATLGKQVASVATGSRRLTGPATATMALTLSKRARASLASTGRLTVIVAVAYSRSPTVSHTTLRLKHATPKPRKRVAKQRMAAATTTKRGARASAATTNGGKS